MKYRKISLVLGFLLVLSMFSFAFVPSVSAHAITVDGNPSDWLADASAQAINTGKWYYGVGAKPYDVEYVWKDEAGDDTGDGDYTYPTNWNNTACADILEFRVTWDKNNVYFLFRMAEVTNEWNDPAGFCQVYLMVLIDNDLAHMDRQEFPDAEACWYTNPEITPDWQLRIRGNNTEAWGWGGTVAVYPWTPTKIPSKGDNTTDCIEVSCPTSLIGDPSGADWKFAVGAALVGEVGRPSSVGGGTSDPMEVNETAGYMCGGGGGSALDPNCWADPDVYDMCFYSSKAAQEGDLSDYDCSATSYPNWYDRCAKLSDPKAQYSGEGWEDLGFRNQMGEIFVIPGAHWGFLEPPVHTPCTEHVINATELGLDIGENFTAQIYVNNVTNLYAWGIDITWDPRCLDLLSWKENWTWFGNPPPNAASGATAVINHTGGYTSGAGWTLTDPNPPISGSGPLVDLKFQVKNYTGAFGIPLISTIRIVGLVGLADYDLNDIFLKEHNALFTKPPPPPSGPTAKIGQSAPPYYVCENISLWSESTGGWNGFLPVAIDNCTWTVLNSSLIPQDVYVNDALVTTPVTINCTLYPGCPIKFHPLVEDTYTIILEVRTKPDAVLDGLGDGYNYDEARTTKTSKKKALIFIDCFTNKMRRCGYDAAVYGMGENLPTDAYMLDELVTLYAWVVYRNNPMQNRLVSFEVYSPQGLFLVEQNMTNANGVAFIKFRIPTLCVNPESLFGKWRCFQKVMLCDNYYNDTVYWDVGWIVHLLDVTIVNENGVPVTEIDMDDPFGVRFYLKNIAMDTRDVLIAIKVLDDNLVPVVFLNFTTTYDGGDWCKPEYNATTIMGLRFPKWIYPGTCKVIVDAWFHTLPSECGHCCCPPAEATFLVTQQEPTPPDP